MPSTDKEGVFFSLFGLFAFLRISLYIETIARCFVTFVFFPPIPALSFLTTIVIHFVRPWRSFPTPVPGVHPIFASALKPKFSFSSLQNFFPWRVPFILLFVLPIILFFFFFCV